MPRKRRAIPCAAVRNDGTPCRAFAMKGSPFCRAHRPDLSAMGGGAPTGNQNRRVHGLYSRLHPSVESVYPSMIRPGETLDEQLALTRLMVIRLGELLTGDRTVAQTIFIAEAIFRGMGRIASLEKAQRGLAKGRSGPTRRLSYR